MYGRYAATTQVIAIFGTAEPDNLIGGAQHGDAENRILPGSSFPVRDLFAHD
jgi:hypothetical protein